MCFEMLLNCYFWIKLTCFTTIEIIAFCYCVVSDIYFNVFFYLNNKIWYMEKNDMITYLSHRKNIVFRCNGCIDNGFKSDCETKKEAEDCSLFNL